MSTDKDREIQQEIRISQNKQIQKIDHSLNVAEELSHPIEEQESHQELQMEVENQQLQEQEINEKQPAQEEQQNADYQQYQQYDQYGDYMMEQSMNTYQRRVSSQNNSQCIMQDLVKIIERQVQKVIELSNFSRQWALLYYETCGWKMDQVHKYIDQKKSNQQMVHYIPAQAEITDYDGMCNICCQENRVILKNCCGDQFCQSCWKGQLTERMRSYNRDPFPPCLNGDCLVRTSAFIAEELAKNDQKFRKLYYRTLCRSYAYGNTSVKMCKGKQKFSCDRCFKINRIFDMLECQNCGNLVCGKCGEQYHNPSECFDGPNWKKVIQQSTNFIQTLNYRICPYCKQAVQRSSGCNSLVCKCKQTFCYICGQKWQPNHTQHGVCYREKQIKALQEQKKKKAQNQKQYIDKLEKFKAQIQNYLTKIRRVDQIDISQQKDKLVSYFKIIANELDYLAPLKKRLRIALLIAKNYILSLYFKQSDLMMTDLSNLKDPIQKAYDFLTDKIPNIIQAFGEKDKVVVNKTATQMRKKGINPQDYLAQEKKQILNCMSLFEKYANIS